MYPVKKRTFSDYKTSLSLSAPNNTAYFLWDEYFKALISSNSCGIKTDWIPFTFLSFEDKIVFSFIAEVTHEPYVLPTIMNRRCLYESLTSFLPLNDLWNQTKLEKPFKSRANTNSTFFGNRAPKAQEPTTVLAVGA